MAVPTEVEKFLAAEKAEWGKWRAKTVIMIDGVRAFNPGHAVPTSHVEKYGYDQTGQVEPADAPPDVPVETPVTHDQGETIQVPEAE